MTTIDQMVQREVNCCLLSLVTTLAQGGGMQGPGRDLPGLCDQASELAAPVLDYEEAAIQNGWKLSKFGTAVINDRDPVGKLPSWQAACEHDGIDPYEWEVYEHWSVSQWLADKLLAQGEKVDTDFAGLCVWARTTTGQAIAMDGCIQRIYAELVGDEEIARQKSARVADWARSQDTV